MRRAVRCSSAVLQSQVVTRIASRECSAQEILMHYLGGIESLEPSVESFLAVDAEAALEQVSGAALSGDSMSLSVRKADTPRHCIWCRQNL